MCCSLLQLLLLQLLLLLLLQLLSRQPFELRRVGSGVVQSCFIPGPSVSLDAISTYQFVWRSSESLMPATAGIKATAEEPSLLKHKKGCGVLQAFKLFCMFYTLQRPRARMLVAGVSAVAAGQWHHNALSSRGQANEGSSKHRSAPKCF